MDNQEYFVGEMKKLTEVYPFANVNLSNVTTKVSVLCAKTWYDCDQFLILALPKSYGKGVD